MTRSARFAGATLVLIAVIFVSVALFYSSPRLTISGEPRAIHHAAASHAASRTRSREPPESGSPYESRATDDWVLTRGRIVTISRQPILFAIVSSGQADSTRSDQQGCFALRVPRGSPITISASGFESRVVTAPATARTAASVGDVVLVGGGHIAVLVVDRDGRPQGHRPIAWCVARSTDQNLNRRVNSLGAESDWMAAGDTDVEGSLAIAGVPTNRWIVVRTIVGGTAPVVSRPTQAAAETPTTVRLVLPATPRLSITSRFADSTPITPLRVTQLDGNPLARWSREYDNPSGELVLTLPIGMYEVTTLVAGRHLLQEDVLLDADRSVQLNAESVASIHLHVTDAAGHPIPRFHAVAVPDDAAETPIIATQLLFAASETPIGVNGLAIVAIPRITSGPPTPNAYAVLVRAPGFEIGRVIIPWSPHTREATAELRLTPGVTVRGVVPGQTAGAEVRLHYLRDPSRVSWWGELAPTVDSAYVDADGAFVLRGYGAATYEVREVTASGEISLGDVVATTGEVRFEGRPSAAQLLVSSSETSAEPVLVPLIEGGKWSPGAQVSQRIVFGTRSGTNFVFDELAPGRYLLTPVPTSGRAWIDLHRGTTIALLAGEKRRMTWDPPPHAVTASFVIRLPSSLGGQSVLVAAVPRTNAPEFAANLAWVPLAEDGHLAIELPAQVPLFVVVALAPLLGEARDWPVVPLHVAAYEDVSALDKQEIHVLPPACLTVTVAGAGRPRVELAHQQLTQVLKDRFTLTVGAPSPPLPPGSCQLDAFDLTQPQSEHTRSTVTLDSGQSQRVELSLRR